jgi:hypothetical protein
VNEFFTLGVNPKKRATVGPQTAFIGPVIRGVFRVAERVFNVTFRVLSPETRAGRFFFKVFGPFSLPVQTTRTVTEDIVSDLVNQVVVDEVTKNVLLPLLKEQANQLYNLYFSASKDGSIEFNVSPMWFADP